MPRRLEVPQSVRDMLNNGQTSSTKKQTASVFKKTRTFDWGTVDGELLRDVVRHAADNGAAVVLGRTSDGGAASITILEGTDRSKFYPSSTDELEELLRWLRDEHWPD